VLFDFNHLKQTCISIAIKQSAADHLEAQFEIRMNPAPRGIPGLLGP
jgi:hypothetical protein